MLMHRHTNWYMVLSHRKGYMFWTDNHGVIRAKLDGSEVVAIVEFHGYRSKCLIIYVRIITCKPY